MLPAHKVVGVAAALSILLALSGCAGEAESPTASLTETKGPTQLLRNEASSRIPTGAIESIAGEEDLSVACKTDDDPEGLYRSWQSSLLATIDKDAAWRVAQISTDLADSFIEDGWYVSGTKDGAETTTLTRPGALSTIKFTSTEGNAEGVGATVHINATGPCVLTEGPDSTEVTKLEGAK